MYVQSILPVKSLVTFELQQYLYKIVQGDSFYSIIVLYEFYCGNKNQIMKHTCDQLRYYSSFCSLCLNGIKIINEISELKRLIHVVYDNNKNFTLCINHIKLNRQRNVLPTV